MCPDGSVLTIALVPVHTDLVILWKEGKYFSMSHCSEANYCKNKEHCPKWWKEKNEHKKQQTCLKHQLHIWNHLFKIPIPYNSKTVSQKTNRKRFLHVDTFWLFLMKRLTRTVERSLRFLINSVLSMRPSPSPSSLLVPPLQFLVTSEGDLSSFLMVVIMVGRDARSRNSFSREHLLTLGLRLSLSKLE